MGSISDNKDYYQKYDWSTAGEEWSLPWGGTRSMWLATIFPRIGEFLPAGRVVEIGAGHGRVAKILHAFTADELILYDIIDECVQVCGKLFEGSSKTRCLKTDGLTLPELDDASVDLAFSFYSLVGANRDTIRAYMEEFDRVLKPEGAAFIHHSNAAMYADPDQLATDQRQRLLSAYRDITVDADTVQQLARQNNLLCIKQECINWDLDEVLSDCFSTIVRPESKRAIAPQVTHNLGFQQERKLAATNTATSSSATKVNRRQI